MEDGAFSGLRALQKLVINFNPLLRNLTSFKGIANVREISITNNSIEFVPVDAFAGVPLVSTLSLAGNRIAHVASGTFRALGALKELILDDNNIKLIKTETFTGLNVLNKLSLNGNTGLKISSGVFRDIIKLKELTLNRLGQGAPLVLPAYLLSGLHQLTTLELQNNSLNEFPSRIFLPVAPNLVNLDLSQNKLGHLEPSDLKYLGNLKSLDLSQTQLNIIPRGTFRPLPGIQKLRLKNNNITHIDNDTFTRLQNLITLDLGNNNINEFEYDSFNDLPNLQNLYLNSNGMIWISSDIFRKLEKLRILLLDSNAFRTLSPEMFTDLVRKTGEYGIPQVTLGDNPIECNCSMQVMKDWMLENQAGIHLMVQCASPPKFLGRFVEGIRDDEYGCSAPVIRGCCDNIVKLKLNKDIKIKCQATGNPTPVISYHVVSGNPFPENRTNFSQDGATVTILNVTFDTSGVFECEAKNIMGSSVSYYRLMFENDDNNTAAIWIGIGLGCVIVIIISTALVSNIYRSKRCSCLRGRRVRNDEAALVNSANYIRF
jgi:Leucine-rich repeat (LRR) protein